QSQANYYTNLNNFYDKGANKNFNAEKKLLFDEVKPLFWLAKYLSKIGIKVKKIDFCSQDQKLGHDGRLQLSDNTIITIQLTRGLNDGKYIEEGKEKYNEELNEGFTKNKDAKGDWLIITVYFAGWLHEGFHETCNIVRQHIVSSACNFKRVIIINEDFYVHDISEKKLLEYLWDSENEEHKVSYLLSLNDLKFDSDDGNLLISLLSKNIYLIKKNLDQVSRWLQSVSPKILEKDEGLFFELYDLVANIGIKTLSTKKNYSVKECPINLAYNHPIGNLTHTLLWRIKYQGNITNDIKKRLIIFLSCPMIVFCLPILIADITFLYMLDPVWTKEYLLYHFDWKSKYALRVWITFGNVCEFPRQIGEESVEEILENLPNAIKHIDLKAHKSSLQNLCYLFARLSVNGHYTYDYSTKFLSKLDIAKLKFISFGIFREKYDAVKKSSELQYNKIDTWLRNCLPKPVSERVRSYIDEFESARGFDTVLKI
ncbi:hypothetical protein RFI_14050, partial [Reticulomyxa filosa]